MLIGSSPTGQWNAVLMEFKQWDSCQPSLVSELVMVGGAKHLHPCAQVHAYREYRHDAHEAFVENWVGLAMCAYLHSVIPIVIPKTVVGVE